MNIEAVRLELVKQAIAQGVPKGHIAEFVEPLAIYVTTGYQEQKGTDTPPHKP